MLLHNVFMGMDVVIIPHILDDCVMVLYCKSSAILKNFSANSDIRGHAF